MPYFSDNDYILKGMKITKRLSILILTFIMVTNLITVIGYSAQDSELLINGRNYNNFILSGIHILAEANEIASAFEAGCQIEGNQIKITKEDNTVVFTADSEIVYVNGVTKMSNVKAQIAEQTAYIPVEFLGKVLDYHIFNERNGKRIRIVSKTGVTAPALEEKEGMAELISDFHRNVPTKFEKSNSLDDLIFYKEDWSGTLPEPTEVGELPTGDVVFTQDDFINEMLNPATNAGAVKSQFNISKVPVSHKNANGSIVMKVKLAETEIGEGNNDKVLPFTEAIRIKSKFEVSNLNASAFNFAKKLPAPTKDDKFVLSYYARLIDGGDPDFHVGKVQFVVQGSSEEQPLTEIVEFGNKWTRFDFLITGVAGADTIRFVGAHEVQTVEIGGFQITNVGADADTSYFNQTKTDLLPQDLAYDAEWRKEALERIEQVRKGDFKVVVKDKQGNPVPDADVRFDMFEHEFKFGVTMDVEYVSDDIWKDYVYTNESGETVKISNGDCENKFIERVEANFNSMALGNRLKWHTYAEDKLRYGDELPTTARVIIDEAKKKGIKYVRGHALWMPNVSYTGEPQGMYNLLRYETDPRSVDERYDDLLKRYMTPHFKEMNDDFPEIYEWDVTNETHGRTHFTDVFGTKIFNDVYRIAKEQLTDGQGLVLCDNRQYQTQYWDRLDWFKEQGIEYDTLGMQGHGKIGSKDIDNIHRPTKYLEYWDRFAYEYGKTFAVTEFSVGAFKDEYGEGGQADYLRDMLIAAYSHPACVGFNIWWLSDYWCFNDWEDPFNPWQKRGAGVAPLYTYWFVEKPGLKVYQDLLYNKWWTRGATTTTNQNGEGTVNGYYGDYDITVTVDGKKVKTEMAAFHKGYENILTITID